MIRAKKSLGQNFLIDKNIIDKITNAVSMEGNEVLEVGPGTGNLTREILKNNPSKMYLIEKDTFLAENLKEIVDERVKIFNEDILKFDENLLSKNKIIVFGNLPYNISTEILSTWITKLKNDYWFSDLILMFQKEFASRLLDSNLNSINALINCFYDVKLKFNVSKNCFRPIPKVNSSILTFERKEEFLLKEIEIDKYIRFKRKLFSHKRKSLKNLLKDYNIKGDFDLNLRAEKLKLTSLIDIFREINV